MGGTPLTKAWASLWGSLPRDHPRSVPASLLRCLSDLTHPHLPWPPRPPLLESSLPTWAQPPGACACACLRARYPLLPALPSISAHSLPPLTSLGLPLGCLLLCPGT